MGQYSCLHTPSQAGLLSVFTVRVPRLPVLSAPVCVFTVRCTPIPSQRESESVTGWAALLPLYLRCESHGLLSAPVCVCTVRGTPIPSQRESCWAAQQRTKDAAAAHERRARAASAPPRAQCRACHARITPSCTIWAQASTRRRMFARASCGRLRRIFGRHRCGRDSGPFLQLWAARNEARLAGMVRLGEEGGGGLTRDAALRNRRLHLFGQTCAAVGSGCARCAGAHRTAVNVGFNVGGEGDAGCAGVRECEPVQLLHHAQQHSDWSCASLDCHCSVFPAIAAPLREGGWVCWRTGG